MKIIPKTISSKLKAYSLFAASATGLSVHAQIIYTDIDPDKHYGEGYPSETFNLNLDHEGLLECSLTGFHHFISVGNYSNSTTNIDSVFISVEPGASVLVKSYSGGFKLPAPLDFGELINYSDDWKNTIHQKLVRVSFEEFPTIDMMSSTGLWIGGKTDKYLGIRFQIDSDTYYGWLRLDVDSTNNSFLVKDYAYNATPNEGIYAGELVSGIQESISDYEIYYACPEINFILPKENKNLNIEILNLSGEIVCNKNLTSNKIDVSDFIPGIYFVRMIEGYKIIAQKEIVIY